MFENITVDFSPIPFYIFHRYLYVLKQGYRNHCRTEGKRILLLLEQLVEYAAKYSEKKI